MTKRLDGKVAVISGGAGGIGSAAGKIFCAQGAKVALIDSNLEALGKAVTEIKAAQPDAQIKLYVADLGVEAEASRVLADVEKDFGRLDVLVNNVGIRRYEPIADAPWEAWNEIVRVNLLSFVSMTRAALPLLRKLGNGSIINVSSTYAVYGRKGMGAYDATKAGVLALSLIHI